MYIPFDDAKRYIELNLHECGREICIPEKDFVYSRKDYHLFHFIVSGRGILEMKGEVFHLKPNTIFYIPPHGDAKYYPDRQDPWTYIWLGFSGSNAEEYMSLMGLSNGNPIIVDEHHRYRFFFDSIHNIYAAKGHLDMSCLGLAYQLFAQIIQDRTKEGKIVSHKGSYILGAKEFILNNFQFAITIDDIANNVGVTPNYLANIFSKYERMSPKQYLIKIRIEKACILLETNRYKVKDVAGMVGYKNQLHFSNEFKKHMKVSPLIYMQKMKETRV